MRAPELPSVNVGRPSCRPSSREASESAASRAVGSRGPRLQTTCSPGKSLKQRHAVQRAVEAGHEFRLRLPRNRNRFRIAMAKRRPPRERDPTADERGVDEASHGAKWTAPGDARRSNRYRNDPDRCIRPQLVCVGDLDVRRGLDKFSADRGDRRRQTRDRAHGSGALQPGRSPQAIRASDAAGCGVARWTFPSGR